MLPTFKFKMIKPITISFLLLLLVVTISFIRSEKFDLAFTRLNQRELYHNASYVRDKGIDLNFNAIIDPFKAKFKPFVRYLTRTIKNVCKIWKPIQNRVIRIINRPVSKIVSLFVIGILNTFVLKNQIPPQICWIIGGELFLNFMSNSFLKETPKYFKNRNWFLNLPTKDFMKNFDILSWNVLQAIIFGTLIVDKSKIAYFWISSIVLNCFFHTISIDDNNLNLFNYFLKLNYIYDKTVTEGSIVNIHTGYVILSELISFLVYEKYLSFHRRIEPQYLFWITLMILGIADSSEKDIWNIH